MALSFRMLSTLPTQGHQNLPAGCRVGTDCHAGMAVIVLQKSWSFSGR